MKDLESILIENFNCKKPFLNEIKRFDDGTCNPFTKSGGKAYGKLIDTLYSVVALVDIKEFNECIENVVETLDNICEETF